MPRSVVSDFSMSVTGTNLLVPSRKTEKETSSAQAGSNSLRKVSNNEVLTQTETKRKPSLKLPALAKTRRLNNEEKNDLQALLRIRCYDFSLQVQGLMPEDKNSNENSSISSGYQSLEDTSDQKLKKSKKDHRGSNKDSSTDKSSVSSLPSSSKNSSISSRSQSLEGNSDQKRREFNKFGEKSDKDSSKDESSVTSVASLPSTTVLEGQRVSLREKNGLDNERKQRPCQPRDKGNKPLFQNDPRPNYRLENMIRSTIVSLKGRKQDTHPLFHLPKVDKYDIISENVQNGSVFRLNDLKSSSVYSGHKDSWIPHRDRYFMNNSEFFKALMQPSVLLRQPSPVAGVKINLREHEEDSLVAAIQVAKETDEYPPSLDTEVIKKVEKIVIRLPPIC
ncbi:hypothetical protein ACROYT_G009896 [Oculina patagonica]